ncbi:Sensory/regulatory protein RpfC [Mycolicibacterium aubagnense]
MLQYFVPPNSGARPGGGAYDTERAQAIIRVVLITAGIVYMQYAFSHDLVRDRWIFLTVAATIAVASPAILAAVIIWPGVYHSRRAIGMAHDYSALGIAMSFGGFTMLPLYSLLLWVTIGNGFRYGPRYHLAATGAALVTLAIVATLSPDWQQQPYVTVTLVLTTILVPAYAHGLLTRLHRARDAALEANLAKSRFLAQASHDLRQPIHAISLFTACLRDTGLDGEQKRMVANIDKSLNSVAGLFRSLLDLSTLDSGRVVVKADTVALEEVLEEVVRQNTEAAQWSGATIRLVKTRHLARVDPGLLTTIVQNVVSNALKYAPGRPVLIGCRRKGRSLSIQICDQGNGIAEHHLPRLFDEFYQVRAPGDKDIEGVGLGLSIVRRLSDLMGLTVSIHSQIGHGTTVTIGGLPVADALDQAARAARSEPPTILSDLRVLLVEDDEIVLAATATLLQHWGCKVRQETGIPALTDVDFDLIISDFDLGEQTTGIDCIDIVRQRAGRPIPAIIMTGHDPEKVRQSISDAGISVLSKPVRPAELRSILVAHKQKVLRFK